MVNETLEEFSFCFFNDLREILLYHGEIGFKGTAFGLNLESSGHGLFLLACQQEVEMGLCSVIIRASFLKLLPELKKHFGWWCSTDGIGE